MRNYEFLIGRFCSATGDRELEAVSTDEVLSCLTDHTGGTKQTRFRYSLLSSFFNFIRNSIDPNYQNPCDNPILKKLFRNPRPKVWKILEKDVVDEIIFRTGSPRDRLMLEVMARGGLRVGEVLKITPGDIEDRC
jgi:integrase/recombinase XerD